MNSAACAIVGNPDLLTMRNLTLLIIEYEQDWPMQMRILLVSAIAAMVAKTAGIKSIDNSGLHAIAELAPRAIVFGFPLKLYLPKSASEGAAALAAALPFMTRLLMQLRDAPAEVMGNHLCR